MKPLVRFSVFLLLICALLKMSEANCDNGQCAENLTETLTTDTTTVTYESNANCELSIGNDTTGQGSITALNPGTVYAVFISCLNCCKEVTTKPEAVGSLTVTDVTTTSLLVTWTEPEGQSSLYRVNLTNRQINTTGTSQNISGLTAGVQYCISVTAVADDNRTEGQSTTDCWYTQPNKIESLTVVQVTTSSISLTWTKPKGESSFYRVQWTNGKTNNNNNVTETKISVTELTAGVRYNFTVIAVAGDNTTESAVAETFHYTKPNVIQNLTVTELTTSSMYVTWSKPEGESSFYRVQWTNGEKDETFNVTETHVNITNLTAGVQYEISVIAVAEDHITEGNSTMVSHYTKPNIVESLTVVQVTTSSISLTWTKPKGESSFYRVQWTNGKTNNNNNVTETKISVTELTAGVQYDFTVIAVAGDNTTESAMAETFHYTKPNVIQNLTVTQLTTSSMYVTWSKPEGESSFYRVQWTNGEKDETFNVTQTHVNITNLTAGVQYEISVIAVAEDHITEGNSTMVSHYTKPNIVEKLTIVNVTTSSISLTWTKPKGESSFYRVQWTNGKTNNNNNVTETKISVTELTAGVRYDFTVIAVAGDNTTESAVAETFHYTKPNVIQNLTVTQLTTSSMYVTWSKPEGESSFYRVQWTNGEKDETFNVTETHVNITNLTAGVQYEISVIAVAEDHITEGNSTMVSHYTKPNIVEKLTVVQVTTSSISLTWTKPKGESSFYRVQWTNGKTNNNNNVTETKIIVTELTAGVRYNFTVIAVAGDNTTESAVAETFHYTKPNVIQNLTVTQLTTSSMYVTWSKPEGESSFYRVQWTNGEKDETFNVTETHVNITNLTAGVQYEISVIAVAEDHITEGNSTMVSHYTKPNIVESLTVVQVTTSSISLTWTKPKGESSFYRVQWTNGKTNNNNNVTETKIIVTELTAGVQYDFTVIAVAGDNTTESAVAETFHYTKPNVIQNLTVTQLTTSSMYVTWSKPEGESSFYRVQWTNGEKDETFNVTETHVNITNLTAGVQYEISVIAVADDHITEGNSTMVSHYTKPNIVEKLTVVQVTTSSISLTWTKPKGESSFYRVQWTNGKTNNNNNVTETKIIVTELTAGVRYDFTVIAVAGDNTTESAVAETFHYTKPNVIQNLTVTQLTTSSMYVTWSKPEGESSFYRVQWTNGEKDETFNVTQTHVNITNLTAGVQYEISVIAVAEDHITEGNSTMVSHYTKPNIVEKLTVVQVTTSSISLTWTKPKGESSFYRVQWTNGKTNNNNNVTETKISVTELTAGVRYDFTVIAVAGDNTTESAVAETFHYTKPNVIQNLTVTQLTTSSMYVTWSKPEGESSFYRVQWTNGEKDETFNVTETHVNITNLTAGVQYEISVIAVAEDHSTEGNSTMVSHYTKPNIVESLTVVQVTTSSISLTWTKPKGESSFYRVQWTNGKTNNNNNVTETKICVTELTAGVRYNFTVIAVAGDNTTESAVAETFHYTKPGKIGNLYDSITNSSIYLNWTQPPGEVFKYRVNWHNGGTVMSDYTKSTFFLLPELIPGTSYTIQIIAVNGANESGEPYTFTSVTKPAAVSNLTIVGTTSSSVSLKWTKPEGNATSYIVQWTAGENSTSNTTTETFFTINGLNPGYQYIITVVAVAVNPSNTGEEKSKSTFTRPVKPVDITVGPRGTDHLSISWTLLKGRVDHYVVNISNDKLMYANNNTTKDETFLFTALHPGRVYDIMVTAVAGSFEETSNQSSFATYPTPPGPLHICHRTNSWLCVGWPSPDLMENAPNISYHITYSSDNDSVQYKNTTVNKTELSLLSSGTRYNISVQTVGPELLKSSDVGISTFTLPNPVLNLKCSTKSTNSVEVTWSPPQGVHNYYAYFVQWVSPAGTHKDTVSNFSKDLSDLEPGTKYNISVRTIAAQGIESADEFTFCYTRPTAVPNINVESVTTTSVQLSWPRQSDHKPSYSYLVMALRDTMLVHNGSTKNETYTFSDLWPGGFYTFKVITEVDGVKSSEERKNSYTRPALVSDIVIMGNTTSLSVSWSAAEGQLDSYTVLLHRDVELVGNGTDLSNTTENHLFEDLKPGVLYCVEVVTIRDTFQNKSAKVCNATFPNPPGAIMVESQTVDSINFTWSLPENMEHLQYNFSVSSTNGSVLVENSWFLLTSLQSGCPYSISVVTVGVRNYESSAVTAQNYTRPYPVTVRADKTEITTNTVTLVWEQPESKCPLSYVVQVSNVAPSETVNITTTMITGLSSGSNYSFTVTTQTADGTQAAPVTVSYFTRPYGIRQLQAETLNTTAVRLFWNEPLEYKPEYTYRVETARCATHKNKTLTGNETQISALTPGTECSFCVVVRAADGIEGEANCTLQYTKPETVLASISSQGSNSSVRVSWTKPRWRVERFKVYLNDTFGADQERQLNSSDTSFLFDGLSAGRIYSAMVTTLSGPFEEPSGFVTNATFPNPPGMIEVLKKTTSSLHIKWEEAPLMNGTSFSYQLSNISAQGGEHISTNTTNLTFTSLQSGTPYNISVATVGVLGFQSATVQINMVTTRPFKVNSLNAFEDEEIITATWLNPDQYKESYRFYLTLQSLAGNFSDKAKDTKFTFTKLDPGRRYNLSVTTETFDGTQSDPTLKSICTKASPVTDLKCEGPNKPKAEVVLSWSCPRGVNSGFNVSVDDIIQSTVPVCYHTVSNLRHYTKYRLTVETQSCGRPSNPESVVCWTGITDPPTLEINNLLVKVQGIEHNKFSLQINSSLLNNTNGPVTYVGVLMAAQNLDTSDFRSYLGKTYTEWKAGVTQAYLATVKETNFKTRSGESQLNIEVGDDTTWEGYTNGALQSNGKYQFAIVLFTDLNLKNGLVDVELSLVSATQFSTVIYLPMNPAVIGLAAGATLGIFFILFIILIGFIIYWKRISNKESPDIQIHSMRAKSAAVRVEDFEAYYKKQTADSNCGFAEEFEDLKAVGTGQPKTIALAVENKPKNRYNNVLPYDSSRVKLSIIHGSPFDDYINANYMPGYNSSKEFIAAQGPLPHTVNEFWRMIWEKNVQTLVMLTRCNEQGRVKCEQYWEHGTKHFENIIVTETSKIPLKDWTIIDFNVKNVKTAETRSLRHFHLTAWPDHGVPETTELLISFRHLVREHMDQYSRHSPAVVHCSAGVGRTGTFIAIDHLIFQIERENMVDVFGIVHNLRMHRPLMVQTEDQYVFLNQCAMDIIRSRTGTNVDLIYQNTAALSIYENVEPKKGFPRNGYYNA